VSLTKSLEEGLSDALGLSHLEPLKGGRTNRVWKSRNHVIKLYAKDGATPLFGNSSDHEWAALTALNGQNIAPAPIDQKRTAFGDVLIYEHAVGEIGYSDITKVARLLGNLHTIDLPSALPSVEVGPSVLKQGSAMIPADDALHKIKPALVQGTPPAFIHRDPVFTNFVSGSDGLRLVDWQCPGKGDPVEDLAHFISPGMNHLYRDRLLSDEDIERFLGAYPDAATTDRYRRTGQSYHWRMACYCAWQVAQGNTAYGPALKAETRFLSSWPWA